MKVVKYDVIIEHIVDAIIFSVNEAIEQGWQPLGGMVIDDGQWFYQPMVMYEKQGIEG